MNEWMNEYEISVTTQPCKNTLIAIAYDTVQTFTCYHNSKASEYVEKQNSLMRSEKEKGVKKRWIMKSINQESYIIRTLWIVLPPSSHGGYSSNS